MKGKLRYIIALLLFTTAGWAQNVGDPAPDFALNSLDNEELTLSQFQGKVVYLFFFGYN